MAKPRRERLQLSKRAAAIALGCSRDALERVPRMMTREQLRHRIAELAARQDYLRKLEQLLLLLHNVPPKKDQH